MKKKELHKILLYVYRINYRTFYEYIYIYKYTCVCIYIYICIITHTHTHITANLRLSREQQDTPSREWVPSGERLLFVLHRVYYNLLCTMACLYKRFSYRMTISQEKRLALLPSRLIISNAASTSPPHRPIQPFARRSKRFNGSFLTGLCTSEIDEIANLCARVLKRFLYTAAILLFLHLNDQPNKNVENGRLFSL